MNSLSNAFVAKMKEWAKRFYGTDEVPSWWMTLKGTIYQTGGMGPSMTKLAYGFVCVVMGLGLLALVYAICWQARHPTRAVDPVLAGLTTGWAGLFMGFTSAAQIRKNTQKSKMEKPNETSKSDA